MDPSWSRAELAIGLELRIIRFEQFDSDSETVDLLNLVGFENFFDFTFLPNFFNLINHTSMGVVVLLTVR